MKIFISQPMSGLELDEIKETRKEAVMFATEFLLSNNLVKDTDKVSILDNLQEDLDPVTTHALEYLGNDIKMLKDAGLICFAKGWEKSKGCNIEFQVAKTYNIKMIFM